MASRFGPEPLEYSTGGPIASQPVYVRHRGSMALTDIYIDADETAEADNPVMTDAAGLLTFFAKPGYYDLVFGGVEFPITVGSPGGLDVKSYTHVQSTPSVLWVVNWEEHLGFRPAGLKAVELTGDVVMPGYRYDGPFLYADFDAPTSGALHMS